MSVGIPPIMVKYIHNVRGHYAIILSHILNVRRYCSDYVIEHISMAETNVNTPCIRKNRV